MTSALEDLFAFQLDSAGLTGYVREYRAIPGRKFPYDFAFVSEKILIEIQGGTYMNGAHNRGVGINRDCEKAQLAVIHGWRLLPFDTKQVKSGAALEVVEKLIGGDHADQR